MTAVVGQTLWTDPEQLLRQNRRQNWDTRVSKRRRTDLTMLNDRWSTAIWLWEASHHQRWTLEQSWHNQFERMLKAAMELERALRMAMGNAMKSLARRSGAVLKSSKQDHDTGIKGLTESGSGNCAR